MSTGLLWAHQNKILYAKLMSLSHYGRNGFNGNKLVVNKVFIGSFMGINFALNQLKLIE
jgi:hypothetical protein